MREIMFRGKDKRNGEWEWGGYFNGVGAAHIVAERLGGFVEMVEVDPETVGEYTGLKDKSGKRIYEGDILRDDWGKIYNVFFSFKSCSFMAEIAGEHSEYETGNYRIGKAWCDTIRVVGNVHDNPDLLKGGTE